MRQKLLLLPLLTLIFLQELHGQAVAQPCATPPPAPAITCAAACVYCNFDGVTGINNGNSGGTVCNGAITLHNEVWLAFIAGTESITVDILTTNCSPAINDGVQVAFFQTCGQPELDCNEGALDAAGIPMSLTYDQFVPGQTYYLMIDGTNNDVCNYEIDVVDGSVTPPPPAAAPQPSGPTVLCPGAVAVYTIPDVEGAGWYRWTAPAGARINATTSNNVQVPAPAGTQVTITFGTNQISGNVCVQAGNACFAPTAPACLPVTIGPAPSLTLDPIEICFEQLPFTWTESPNQTLNLTPPGLVDQTFNLISAPPYDSYLGCDSTVRQAVTLKARVIKQLPDINLCQGECYTFPLNNVQYCTGGVTNSVTIMYDNVCDTTYRFRINMVPSVANIQPVAPVDCSSPPVVLNSQGSTTLANAMYRWTNAVGTTLGTGTTQAVPGVGTYNLIVTTTQFGRTCRDTATISVSSNAAFPGATATGGTLTCNNQTVTLQAASMTPGVNYQWAGPGITPANQFLQNPVVNTGGTYTVSVTNPSNGCTSVANAEVLTNNTPPVASAVGDTITCAPNALTATLNGGSTVAGSTFQWAGPGITPANQSQEDPVVTAAGTYTLTVTIPANGCTHTATATVLQNNTLPVVGAGADQNITCQQQSVVLGGSASGSGPLQITWTGPGITPANQSQLTPTVTIGGTYTLTVLNAANSCQSSDAAVVTALVALPTASAGADQVLTCAVTSVTLNGLGSSQGAGLSASWAGPGITPANQNLYSPSVGLPGIYTITITNSNTGCTATDQVEVTQNLTAPTANAGTDQVLTCTSTNGVMLSGSGTPANISYLWSGPGIGANNATQQNPMVTVAGTYQLEVTNPTNGCKATDQVEVTQDANVPVANAGADLTLNCSVTTVNINASASSSGPNISYQWSGPGITPANAGQQSPQNLNAPGTYNLTVTNTANSCFNTDVLVIAIDTIRPTAVAGPAQVLNCFNNGSDTLNSNGSSTGANFSLLWSGPGINAGNQNSPQPVVSAAGTYTLQVTNTANTCSATAQTSVSDDQQAPTADAGTDKTIDCVTTTATLGGSSSTGPEFGYAWTGPDITPANANLAAPVVALAGTYNLVVTDNSNGCTASNDALVTSDAVFPTANAGQAGLLTCDNPDFVLDGSASSNGANFQITWTGAGITPATQNALSPTISLPGTYILTVRNLLNSCESADTVLVDEDKVLPLAAAGNDATLNCQITTLALNSTGSSTGANIGYLWTGPGITPASQNLPNPTVGNPGTYVLLVENNDNGCTATDQVDIAQDVALPTASAGADLVLTCQQNSQQIDGAGSSTGANISYLWTGPGINSGNFNQQSPTVDDPGLYNVTVTNTQNNCTATDAVQVDLDADLPATNGGPDQILTCANDTLQLDGSASLSGAGITYAWAGPGIVAGEASNQSPNIFQPGNYTITVTNTLTGCSATDLVMVVADVDPPFADAGLDRVLTCATSATGVALDGSASSTGPNFSLQWSGSGITPANQNLVNPVVTGAGAYTLLVTNIGNGCTATDDMLVSQDQNLPTAAAGNDQTITCAVGTVTLNGTASTSPSGQIQYLWSGPGITPAIQGNATVSVTVSGNYTLTVINPVSSCQATDNVLVNLDTQAPTASATGDTITCTQPNGTLTASTGATNPQFAWSGPGINAGNANLATLQVNQPGAYSVTVTAQNGCTAAAVTNMAVDANFPTGAAEGTVLNCTNDGQSTVMGSTTAPGVTYFWSNPAGQNISSNLSANVSQPGQYTFNIVAANGCVNPIPVQVLADFEEPEINLEDPDVLTCESTTVAISAVGTSSGSTISYEWTTNDGNIVSGFDGLSLVVDAPGEYQLLVLNSANGCSATETVTVENDPNVPTALDLEVRDVRCFGEKNGSIAISSVAGGTGPFVYSLNGETATTTDIFSGLAAGEYLLSMEDANGCVLDTMVNIIEPGELVVELGPDLELFLGDSATVRADIQYETPLASVDWNLSPERDSAECCTFTYKPLQSYRHEITVLDSNGCVTRDVVLVTVKKVRRVFIPNILNLNTDNPENALIFVQGGNDVAKVRSWLVFDRWGNAVHEVRNFLPNDPATGWAGTIRGDKAAPAVFAWMAEIEFIDGQVELYEGDITLIR